MVEMENGSAEPCPVVEGSSNIPSGPAPEFEI